MRESGYYHPGTEFDPRAPWNQPEEAEAECPCGNPMEAEATYCEQCHAADAADAQYEAMRERELFGD